MTTWPANAVPLRECYFDQAISIKSLKRLRDVFLDQFLTSFDTPPRHLTFDLDAIE
jgi:hypothetical protein